MATTTHVPVEVYLRSSYEPDAEYVDGQIEKRPMGEFDHAAWKQAIQRWFLQHDREWGIRVLPELRIKVAATRYRVPDVTVLDRSRPIEQTARFIATKTCSSVAPNPSPTPKKGSPSI